MQITFVTNTDTFPINIDPDMKLQDVQALLEAEVSALLVSLLLRSCVTHKYTSPAFPYPNSLSRSMGASSVRQW